MRVAIFTDTYLPDVNGVAKTLGRWIDFLKSRHIACKVFAPNHKFSSVRSESFVERFASVPFLLYPECRFTVANPVYINDSIRQFAPTLIHVATPYNMGLYGKFYAAKQGIPLVASYHTHFDQYLSYYKIQWLESAYWRYMHWFHEGCEKIFVPSESTRQYLQDKGFSDLEIWSRGIDTSKFNPIVDRHAVLTELGISPTKFVMLYVGRLAPEKDVHVLMNAFVSLPQSIRDQVHVVMAGDGPLYKEFSQIASQQYPQQMTVLGFVEGMRLQKLFAAADLFIFPSPTETFGNVVLEAMASGTPVIGANQGGVADNIQDGITGLLCPPKDSDAFSKAIEMLYHNQIMRNNISLAGIAYSKSKNWDKIFTHLFEQYEQVLNPELRNMVI